MLGALYGLFGVIVAPFLLLAAFFGGQSGGAPVTVGGVFLAVLFPVLSAITGFVGGALAAAIYNLVAKWVGGLEFELREVPPAA